MVHRIPKEDLFEKAAKNKEGFEFFASLSFSLPVKDEITSS